MQMPQPWDLVVRLITAGILGAVIGFERKAHLKDAGIRTHFILAIGSALIMVVSKYGFHDMYGITSVSFDPSRIAAQVVSGIGFVGAGMIIFRRNTVLGLTTATGLWATAGVGLAAGSGMYVIAISGTILILIGLTTLKSIEHRFVGRIGSIVVTARDRKGLISDLETTLHEAGLKVQRISITRSEEDDEVEIEVTVRVTKREGSLDALRSSIVRVEGVEQVKMPNVL
jgi:putative Mg2+ transporter-C (MgtC) family protein